MGAEPVRGGGGCTSRGWRRSPKWAEEERTSSNMVPRECGGPARAMSTCVAGGGAGGRRGGEFSAASQESSGSRREGNPPWGPLGD